LDVTSIDRLVGKIVDAVQWETTGAADVSDMARGYCHRLAEPSSSGLRELVELLRSAVRRKEERRLSDDVRRVRDALTVGAAVSGAVPLWSQLRSALEARDWAEWSSGLAEAARLTELERPVSRRDELARRLSEVAPGWCAEIIQTHADEDLVGSPEDVDRYWEWRRAATWLDDLLRRGDLAQLQAEVSRLQQEESATVLEIARRGAALGLKRNLKDSNRRALSSWLNALTKFGRGYGKYSAHWQTEARRHLPGAMGAVPVWIMPIHRVIENFDPRVADLFDVVIVDESSQCDLLSVGVLALGEKAVVVGDDRQTSPAAVGVDQERVIQLQDTYLYDVREAHLLTANESLYALAERIFPSTVLLREHFRCVPEIIDFSNRRYYDNEILPLREPSTAAIGQALQAVCVAEGACIGSTGNRINRREAEALADQVAACTANPAYVGMTFGVVTLLGNSQGPLLEELIRKRIGVGEFRRRLLRVGNPAVFQGDERHVIFISVVADDNSYSATKLPDGQRINVAASRAQDQLWVFHTVDPATLHPDDHRRALIEYVRDSPTEEKRSAGLLDRCESDFERHVVRDLLNRRYQVDVQHRVGRYRIDIVVSGERSRLAVECDGDRFHGPEQWDQDMRRQRQLERLGWTFCRIRASEYYRQRAATIDALVARLEDLEIEPTSRSRLDSGAEVLFREPPTHVGDEARAAPDDEGSARDRAEVARGAGALVRLRPVDDSDGAVEDQAVAPHQDAIPSQADAGPSRVEAPPVQPPEEARIDPDSVPVAQPIRTAKVTPRQPESDRHNRDASAKRPWVPVPDGYRQVGWIRPHEAAAAADAYRLRQDVQVVDPIGGEVGRARFLPPEDPDVRKFRAQVSLHRFTRSGERVVAWIREHEAAAIIEAARLGTDVELDADGAGSCLVQFFPAGGPEARTFRSTTRLHRRRS
jgi:very-short-patch-repair endonuclease